MAKANNPLHVFPDGKITFKKIASRFSEAVIKWLDGDKGSILQALTAALSGKTADAQTQAFGLIVYILRTYSDEFFERYFESELQQERKNKVYEHTLAFHQSFLEKLDTLDIYIDKAFVENPINHPTTAELHRFFSDWIINDLKLTEDAARIATSRFPRRLLGILAGVTRNEYTQLFESLETPFYVAEQKAQALDAYQDTVAQVFDRPAFTDPRVRLADMYVQPYFRYFKPKKEDDENGEREGHFVRPKPKYHLIELAQDWLSGNCKKHIPNADARILLLLGQPGQGKSSFTRYLAWHLLSENSGLVDRVFLIRLRDLDKYKLIEDPLNDLLHYLQELPFAAVTFEKHDLKNSLLILDGLDEFYMNNGLGSDDVEKFLKNLKRDIELECTQRNPANPIKCLITSRSNYVKLDVVDKSRDLLIAEIDVMSKAEQSEWLSRFENNLLPEAAETTIKQAFINVLREDLEQINNEDKYEKIRMLVNQPILLQITVEASVSPIQSKDRVSLYERMFDYLVARKWEQGKSPQLDALKPIVENEEDGPYFFRRFLQAFALLIFYKEKEYALRSDFRLEPLKSAFEDLQGIFGQVEPDSLVKRLLISFYFREVVQEKEAYSEPQDRSNYAYEFLHKSFQEYLIAEYIWIYFKETLTEKDKRGKWLKADEDAMQAVFQLFAPRLLTPEIVDYLYEFVAREEAIEPAVFERATSIMHGLAEHSYILEYDWKKETQNRKRSTPLEQSLAVFYGLLSINGAIVAQKAKNIAWPSARDEEYESTRQALATPLQFLPNTQLSADLLLLLRRNYGDEAKLSLSGADLRRADLRGADLRRADISWADLSWASLSKADLSGAELRAAYLSLAYLSGADIRGANLSGANLILADLSGADLSGADLSGADLSGADLRRADLRGADLSGADLSGADLEDADLYKTKFSSDDIYGPTHTLAQIKNLYLAINLERADWRGTIYKGYTAEHWARFRKERAGQEDV